MAGRLTGKVALVSGAARGQGEAEARLFVNEGAKVVLGDVLVEAGQKVAADIAKKGGQATFVKLDVTQEVDWQQVVETTVRTYGKLDILVNNAGIFRTEGVEATSLELWNQVIAVNQTGVWLGMKCAIPAMRKAGGGGAIVNISSGAGMIGTGFAAAYHGTKGAVRILTKTAAVEYAKEGIRINSVHPGFIDTEMIRVLNPEGRQAGVRATPLGRMGTSENIAYAVLFLASDESSFITGSELVIDGGYTAQ